MKIVLATGIYPPQVGGPATYVRALAQQLVERGMQVTVLAYGQAEGGDAWSVVSVSREGTVFARWLRYARALRLHAADADVVYAFSSVSVGVPMVLARLPGRVRRVLRLGGDFGWERATDMGCPLGLEEWYRRGGIGMRLWRVFSTFLLRRFHCIVFSTTFQQDVYRRFYRSLPQSCVIENAFPTGAPLKHTKHQPLRLLSFGRQVAFKNLLALVAALQHLSDATLTVAGDGPVHASLQAAAKKYGVEDRVRFLPSQHADAKITLFAEHDLLVVPSLTDISPNAALEARAAGLPVVITLHTGLSTALTDGMYKADCSTPARIAQAVQDVAAKYERIAQAAAAPLPERGWSHVLAEHEALFTRMMQS